MGICCSKESITDERTYLPEINIDENYNNDNNLYIDENYNNDNNLYIDTKQKFIDEYNIWICNKLNRKRFN